MYDVDLSRDFCKQLNIDILRNLLWVSITQTFYKLLAHSPGLIEHNDQHTLKNVAKEGMEGKNKELKKFETNCNKFYLMI